MLLHNIADESIVVFGPTSNLEYLSKIENIFIVVRLVMRKNILLNLRFRGLKMATTYH